MTTKVNILFDGGFFVRKFKERESRSPVASDIQKEVEKIIELVKAKTNGETKDILFRVFYYDCNPYGGKIKIPKVVDGKTEEKEVDFSQTKEYEKQKHFLEDIGKLEQFALRLGELSFNGFVQDKHNPKKIKPNFQQKGVDMKVGLDMAEMANKHLVHKIVLVAGDSDFVSLMKYVRKEGIQVYLYSMGHKIKYKLKEHSDFILS